MQSLGEILTNARTEKGYSIDQVAHETNISRNYIQDLEREAFEEFPAEAYLIGFLRNYSEYLGLDAEKMISLYRNHKLSEEPSPIEELVGKKKSSKLPIIPIAIGLGAVLLIVVGIRVFPGIKNRVQENRITRQQEEEQRLPKTFSIETEEQLELQIINGDTLEFKQRDILIQFKLNDLEDHYGLVQVNSLSGENHQFSIRLQEELFLSLFQDTPDFRLFLKDYGLTSGESILLVEPLVSPEEMERVEEEEVPIIDEVVPQMTEVDTSGPVESHIIQTLNAPERFTLDIKFRGYSLYRYELDGRYRDERYYKDGDAFREDVNRKIQVWFSNAGAAYAKVNGQEIPLGEPGEVTVKTIQWVKNDQGSYDLVLLPVY